MLTRLDGCRSYEDLNGQSPGIFAPNNPPPLSPNPLPSAPPGPLRKTFLGRHRTLQLQNLAETTRVARDRLQEARAMKQRAGSAPRGRSANDCPRENAERHVKAWAKEAARAERAESLAARKNSINELEQVCLRQSRSWGGWRGEGVRER